MDDRARANLAEQLQANPLFDELLSGIETDAVEAMVYADTDEIRAECAMRVKAIRTLRSDCQQMIDSARERKAAPA